MIADESRKMKLWIDRPLAAAARLDVVMTRPLLTDLPNANDRWKKYADVANSLFELSTLANCDFAVLPFPWQLAIADDAVYERST